MIESSQGALARWERLVVTLAAHGVTATLTRRVAQGCSSYSIYLRTASGRLIIGDSEWRGHWTGWEVTEQGADSLCTMLVNREKTRGGVARAVIARLVDYPIAADIGTTN